MEQTDPRLLPGDLCRRIARELGCQFCLVRAQLRLRGPQRVIGELDRRGGVGRGTLRRPCVLEVELRGMDSGLRLLHGGLRRLAALLACVRGGAGSVFGERLCFLLGSLLSLL